MLTLGGLFLVLSVWSAAYALTDGSRSARLSTATHLSTAIVTTALVLLFAFAIYGAIIARERVLPHLLTLAACTIPLQWSLGAEWSQAIERTVYVTAMLASVLLSTRIGAVIGRAVGSGSARKGDR